MTGSLQCHIRAHVKGFAYYTKQFLVILSFLLSFYFHVVTEMLYLKQLINDIARMKLKNNEWLYDNHSVVF